MWRPKQNIRVITIGLHWRDGLLLAAEVRDDSGKIKGVRPLGGGVDFGETWQQALTREFKEELDISVTISGAPLVMENIYVHEGEAGHEIVFIADVQFSDGAFEGQEVIKFSEDNGVECTARWFDLDDLDNGKVELFPSGLKELLLAK